MDHVIFRTMAKIAFNYLAYWEGGPFVQQQGFDRARRYIRWGEIPDYKLLRVDEEAILGDEPTVGSRRLCHLITVSWAGDGVCNPVALARQLSSFRKASRASIAGLRSKCRTHSR